MNTTQIRWTQITRYIKMAGRFSIVREAAGYVLCVEGQPFGIFETSKAAQSAAARMA